MLAYLLPVLVLAAACSGRPEPVPTAPVRVAAAPDAEAALLAATLAALLEAGGLAAEVVPLADDRSGRQALELGDVDVHLGYSGQVWLEVLGRANPPGDPVVSVEELRRADAARGLVWFVPEAGEGPEQPPANATFAFFVAGPPSVDADLRTLSQLALRLSERPDASICVDAAFGERPDGLAALLSAYSVRRDRPFLAATAAQAVRGVEARDCLAGLSHATDGRAWRAGLLPLVDDLRVLPAFVPAPVVRTGALARWPGLGTALAPFGRLSTADLGRANARVAAGDPIATVARDLARDLVQDLARDRAVGVAPDQAPDQAPERASERAPERG